VNQKILAKNNRSVVKMQALFDVEKRNREVEKRQIIRQHGGISLWRVLF
jgi:hypothetical protein